jgi:hypothetical protein
MTMATVRRMTMLTMTTTMLATALQATKLRMMATTMTIATGDDDNDGNSAIGDGMTGYYDDDDGNG